MKLYYEELVLVERLLAETIAILDCKRNRAEHPEAMNHLNREIDRARAVQRKIVEEIKVEGKDRFEKQRIEALERAKSLAKSALYDKGVCVFCGIKEKDAIKGFVHVESKPCASIIQELNK